jgi:hypothetical protein
MGWIKVLDQDERNAGTGRQRAQKFLAGVETAR